LHVGYDSTFHRHTHHAIGGEKLQSSGATTIAIAGGAGLARNITSMCAEGKE
jgi:hypothetical protein